MSRILTQAARGVLMLIAGAAIVTVLLVIAQLIIYGTINW